MTLTGFDTIMKVKMSFIMTLDLTLIIRDLTLIITLDLTLFCLFLVQILPKGNEQNALVKIF